MATIDTKNYKKYLIKPSKANSKVLAEDVNFSDQFVVIDQNDPNFITISKRKNDGSWSTTKVVTGKQSKSDVRKLSDTIAQHIFTHNTFKLKNLKIKEVSIKNYKKYIFSGNSSIRELAIDIYSTESEDDSLLHFLLGRVKTA